MATPQQTPPVLSLTTLIPRLTIKIDGKPYDLITADEFAWLDYRGKAGVFREAAPLMVLRRRTKKQEKDIERLLGPLVQTVVKAPATVLARLTNAQRVQVLEVFSRLLPTKPLMSAVQAGAPTRGRRSSTKTRPASK
jgi:hypothetical protein